MIEVRQTDVFADWFAGLRDREARARITVRIRRLALGNPGDVKPVGGGVLEMRIDYGRGYRVYFVRRGETIVVLLCGGDKAEPGSRHRARPRTGAGSLERAHGSQNAGSGMRLTPWKPRRTLPPISTPCLRMAIPIC